MRLGGRREGLRGRRRTVTADDIAWVACCTRGIAYRPRMTADPAIARSAGAAARYDAWFESAWGAHAWAVESSAVIASLGAQPGWRIVDVGCGTGRLFEHLLAGAAQAIGVDRDAGMLDRAAVRAPGSLVRADAGRLPLADRSVDAAVAVTVLEFSTHPASVLAEMARVTRPGGRLVVGVLNPHSPWGWADQARSRHGAWANACFLPHRQLLTLGRRHGAARMNGVLFGWRRMPRPHQLGRPLEGLRRLAPRLGAFQLLTVDLPGAAP